MFANEKVRPHELETNPDVSESSESGAFRVLNLDALVRIKLTAWCDEDRTHLRDLIEVGLIDRLWMGSVPSPLGQRLQSLFDSPER